MTLQAKVVAIVRRQSPLLESQDDCSAMMFVHVACCIYPHLVESRSGSRGVFEFLGVAGPHKTL